MMDRGLGHVYDLHGDGFDAGIDSFCVVQQRKWIRLTLQSVPPST